MSPPPVLRWRLDCRKQRGAWKTTLTQGYALLCQATMARRAAVRAEEWDAVTLVPVWVEETWEGKRLMAVGAIRRDGCLP